MPRAVPTGWFGPLDGVKVPVSSARAVEHQSDAARPMIMASPPAQQRWRRRPVTRPVFPQTGNKLFLVGIFCFVKCFASKCAYPPIDTRFSLNQARAFTHTIFGKKTTSLARLLSQKAKMAGCAGDPPTFILASALRVGKGFSQGSSL